MSDAIPRPRRLRTDANLRQMLTRVSIEPHNVIVPLFICEGANVRRPIGKMPGIFQMSVDVAIPFLQARLDEGFKSCLIFGVIDPSQKDPRGSPALDPDNIVCRLLRSIDRNHLPIVTFTDLCFCQYTSHGHCGLLAAGAVDNDATVNLLVEQAINHAQVGAQFVSPSGMMDGAVAALRHGLDAAGFTNVGILAYSVKYASAFYGPFRDAAGSAPTFGDRRAYQMDPARGLDEALHEAELDIAQGADMTMVKPAGPNLDIIAALRQRVRIPLVAYQTSGEYALYEAAAANGWIDHAPAVIESLLSIRRAGADLIISYYTDQLPTLLKSHRAG